MTDHHLLAIGTYISGSLYLIGCFAAGVIYHVPMVWQLTLISAGVSFLCALAQAHAAPRWQAIGMSVLSNAAAALAGLELLWRV